MSVLYGKQLHVDPKNPKMEDRDMVVLSKGHAGPAWYCALAEKGFFDKEWLMTLMMVVQDFQVIPTVQKLRVLT